LNPSWKITNLKELSTMLMFVLYAK